MAFFVLDNATDKAGRIPSMKKYVHRSQQEKKRQIVRSSRKYIKGLLGYPWVKFEFLTWSIFLFFFYYLILPLCSKVSNKTSTYVFQF